MQSKNSTLLASEPVPTLLARVRAELSVDFKRDMPTRLSRAPARLDVMGGIADYTGSLVVQGTLNVAAAVALQERGDDQLQVFSFNQLDEHKPFTLRMPLRALAMHDAATLRREFAEPNRQWAGRLAGCLHVLHADGLVDLMNPVTAGLSVAVSSSVPAGARLGASAAITVATMMNCVEHFGVADRVDALQIARLSRRVESEMLGIRRGAKDYLAAGAGEANALARMLCQPHDVHPPLRLPHGITVFGIDSGVRTQADDPRYDLARCAAFMGHAIILHQMRELGAAAGATLTGDPMSGYLARLDPDDYKKLFRPRVPEQITGQAYLDQFGPPLDPFTQVDPRQTYLVQHATDHHVLEARRVKRFVESIEAAAALPPGPRRKLQLDRAGHLMYASHQSYTMDAMLGSVECDGLVAAVRSREHDGFYGAKITGAGAGGTVAVLSDDGEAVRAVAEEIMTDSRARTGQKSQAFFTGGDGAWRTGTAIV